MLQMAPAIQRMKMLKNAGHSSKKGEAHRCANIQQLLAFSVHNLTVGLDLHSVLCSKSRNI
jgi:hypothetical protein